MSGRNAESAKTAKESIEAIFKTGGAGTCEGLVPYFTPKVGANPGDVVLLKKVLGLLEDAKCNDSDLYYSTAENLYKVEKSPVAAYHLAEMNADKKNFARAEVYYLEATKLEQDPIKRSNYLTKISTIELTKKDYKAARDYARQAIENDPTNGTAFMLIGNAYASIKPFSDDFENQAIYWLAADYLIKARQIDSSLNGMTNDFLGQITVLFPTKSECFFRGYLEEGVSFPVGGWINENTTVRFRKE
jgi:tetratricopeptide (TPR) repeat protein